MRLERLNYNKIKIFLTLDDLNDRGLTKEDVWKDSLKWHQLFHEMLEEASEEFGVDIQGSVAVEIFSMQSQGMVMIVTMEEQMDDEELLEDGFIEMQVTVEGSEDILFEFQDFEDVIQMAAELNRVQIEEGSLYSYKEKYYYHVTDIAAENVHRVIAILAEYGDSAFTSIHVIQEYGKVLIESQAVKELVKYFP
ncbi:MULTISPECIES: genetic competence negative regulator [Cytobacillus]|uniref:genetic competence negative regulator n=1 Tax=Cytobacillus TaxID=2675230 RepID=UPI00203E6046|nr:MULTISPECIES: genetic competence negative regulator [Cytobacillus]MCS0826479.1 genetic competence negative regulator [Cytobacillus firmus]MCM3243626.1 genetic competence negative regulator [Cytobacillus oceanisediminis]MCM3393897.1 genetic competence negative regulator [Cytobacillus oceanisediminis]UQX54553.1 genetic competence negative regulator [Cytobacillus pseudoceanisediminis]USK42950.1 genetic competence negative regulator [Cytobacillus oceanisediminis]